MKLEKLGTVILLSAAAGLAQAAPVGVFATTDTMFGDTFQSKSYGFTVGDLGAADASGIAGRQ